MYLHVLRLAHMCMHVHACNSHDPNIVIFKAQDIVSGLIIKCASPLHACMTPQKDFD